MYKEEYAVITKIIAIFYYPIVTQYSDNREDNQTVCLSCIK